MKIVCKYKACILKFAKCIHSTYNHLVVNIKYQLILYEKVWNYSGVNLGQVIPILFRAYFGTWGSSISGRNIFLGGGHYNEPVGDFYVRDCCI